MYVILMYMKIARKICTICKFLCPYANFDISVNGPLVISGVFVVCIDIIHTQHISMNQTQYVWKYIPGRRSISLMTRP